MTTSNVALKEAPAKAVLALDARGAKLHLLSYHRARKAGLNASGELALYALLTLRALKNEAAWTQTASSVLAAELDVSERTVTRWLGALVDAGWIHRRSVAKADGTLQVARTRLPALEHGPSVSNRVTEIAQTGGEGRAPSLSDATEILDALEQRGDFQRIVDRGLRDRLAAEIVWATLGCALSRLPSRALALNVAMKKVRERSWRTPRSMPSDYPTQLARQLPSRFRRGLHVPTHYSVGAEPARPPVAESVRMRTPAVAAQFLSDLAERFSRTPTLSENNQPLRTYQESGCCAAKLSRDDGPGGARP